MAVSIDTPRQAKWDVFISHASEDRAAVVLPLGKLLAEAGLRVWVDGSALTLGDSLRSKIDEGLTESRFGVVILSRAFLSKEWPKQELDAILTLELYYGKRLLPVLHGITAKDVANHAPLIAGKLMVSTATGIGAVASEIVQSVRNSNGAVLAAAAMDMTPLAAAERKRPLLVVGLVALVGTCAMIALLGVTSGQKIKTEEPPRDVVPAHSPSWITVRAVRTRMGSTTEEQKAIVSACSVGDAACDAAHVAREQLRETTLDSYLIQRYEVSNAEYVLWLNKSPGVHTKQNVAWLHDKPLLRVEERFSGIRAHDGGFEALPGRELLPVVLVTWYGAMAYCAGLGARLPLEAEWEHAARGAQRTQFPWGNSPPQCSQAVFGRVRGGACESLVPGPRPVAESEPGDVSPLGVAGLAGNAREWVDDIFHRGISNNDRVVKGGGWWESASSCRGGRRGMEEADGTDQAIGFRCAMSAKEVGH